MAAPNSITENLMQSKKPQAALVLDSLFDAGIQTSESLAIPSILGKLALAGIHIGESILRRGLFDLAKLGLLVTRKILNRAKGRPYFEYRLGTITGMAKVLGVKLHLNEAADSIDKTEYKTVAAYRAAKHYTFLKRLKISQLSRKRLGARLGVSGRSTYNYESGKDLEVIHRTEKTKLSKADIESAPLKRPHGNLFLEVEFERELTEDELNEKYKDFDPAYKIFWRRKTVESRYMPYTRFILERELNKGNTVYLVKQVTNEYRVN